MLTRLTALTFAMASLNAHALTLSDALTLAHAQAPELRAGAAATEAAQQLTISAGQLPDPKLQLGIDDWAISGDNRFSTANTMKSIGVMQDVPNAGKREAERQIAAANLRASQAQAHSAELNLTREVTLAWLNLYYSQQKLALISQRQQQNTTSQQLAKLALASGGNSDAALAARQEGEALADAADEAQRDIRLAQVRLARWLGARASEAPSGELPAWLSRDTTDGELESQPDITAAHAQASAAQAQLDMARAAKTPDLGVEVLYKRDGMGQNLAMVQFSIDLPLWGSQRQDPKIAAAVAELTRSQAEKAQRLADVRQEYASTSVELALLQSQLDRVNKQTLPRIAQQLELAKAAFGAGKSSASVVLAMRQDELAARIRALDLQSQLAASRTRLYYLTGAR